MLKPHPPTAGPLVDFRRPGMDAPLKLSYSTAIVTVVVCVVDPDVAVTVTV